MTDIPHITAKTLTLHWHENTSPIYTVDMQPSKTPGEKSIRLVTGGGDNNVRIWKLNYNDLGTEIESVEYLSTITKHTQAVNCVRFNSTGELLATASDDGTIMIWELSEKIVKEFGSNEDDEVKESWVLKIACFSTNLSEIYDLCWSPDSKYICCGLMDNIVRIFSVSSGSMINQIAEHNHYVQGVAWDPLNEYICSQSADKSVHIYKISNGCGSELSISPTSFYKSSRAEIPTGRINLHEKLTTENLKKNTNNEPTIKVSSAAMAISNSNSTTMEPPLQTPKHKRSYSNSSTSSSHSFNPLNRCSSPLPAVMPSSPSISYKQHYIYHNETLQSFFRRLSFSPDGLLLLTASGIIKNNNDETINTVYIHTRQGLNKPPVAHLPGFKKPAIAIRFSPIKYKLIERESGGSINAFNMSYRMLFAVATQDSIVIYDTQRLKAVALASNLHYAVITDVCWSSDGKSVLVCSSDGFVSSIVLSGDLTGEMVGGFEVTKMEKNTGSIENSESTEQIETKKTKKKEEEAENNKSNENMEKTGKASRINSSGNIDPTGKKTMGILDMLSKDKVSEHKELKKRKLERDFVEK